MSFRAVIAAMALLAGIIFTAKGLWNGTYGGAAGYFLAGMLAASATLFGRDICGTSLWRVGVALFTVLGLYSVLFETPGFDVEKGRFEIDVTAELIEASMPLGPPVLAPKEREILRATLLECATQPEVDMMESAIAANKTVHLGPSATLVDSSIQTLSGSNREERCLSGFKILYKAAPGLFATTVKTHEAWLKKHGVLED
ncbi:hypothetical protein [Pandoraea pnomenusa]|uniref:hypothetical protein n=1 Tax=Pandoraea pnomenusa TaxID=93220 RepID=UPI003342942B